jgi:hypothetical protein
LYTFDFEGFYHFLAVHRFLAAFKLTAAVTFVAISEKFNAAVPTLAPVRKARKKP